MTEEQENKQPDPSTELSIREEDVLAIVECIVCLYGDSGFEDYETAVNDTCKVVGEGEAGITGRYTGNELEYLVDVADAIARPICENLKNSFEAMMVAARVQVKEHLAREEQPEYLYARLRKTLRDLLKEDILERYDGPEYWDPDVIEVFRHDNKLTQEQVDEMVKQVSRGTERRY